MKTAIHAVIFDLDGTLADTLDDIADSVNAALASKGYPVHPVSAYRLMVGNGMRTLIARVIPTAARTDTLIEELRADASTRYAHGLLIKTKPYPGIATMLETLAARKIPCAVLSNKPDILVGTIIEGLFPGNTFSVVRGELQAFAAKPSPASALDIAGILGFPAHEIIYVGDSDVDVQTARNAGMVSAGAAWGFRGRDELLRAGADFIIDHPGDLFLRIQG